ncbi:SCO family protein [Arcticibacterium luteifluviistationis]|uniref:SCO family protein n=2 Tax=Arcticibacterium luteifluviistationis TaxID=1784714 RepID=A0A2Z4GIG4_9BACT|nr:SCO family protein [Arcticibacterium luteifluviistationis]
MISCQIKEASLPILGRTTMDEQGNEVPHQIPDFSFINQYGETVTNADLEGKVYVTDFFFTSCPTICPVMKSQMLRVYEHFMEDESLAILSHTIDPYHDSVQVLQDYAAALGVTGKKWQFVTGDQDEIYKIAEKSYMVAAAQDTIAPEETGGFIHSGAFILVDKKRHVRGVYDGTVEEQVNQLMKDIELLLKEED